MTDRTPRIRRAAIPEDAVILVRGEVPPPAAHRLAEQFRLRFPDWGRFGLSAFYARDERDIDHLAHDRLMGYEMLRVYPVAALLDAGFEVVPTFRRPHVTICWTGDLEAGLERLASTEHDQRVNPYHEGSE